MTNPTVKSSAESAAKGVEGVEKVDNQIEVLPVSPMDDGFAANFTVPFMDIRRCSVTRCQ